MTGTSSPIPGFSDPVHEAQAVFRTLMQVLAEPAQARKMNANISACGLLLPNVCACLLALADYDTPIWLDPSVDSDPEVLQFIRFRTGAPVVLDPALAAFAIVSNVTNMPALDAFSSGTSEYPDRSTTFILQVDRIYADGPRYHGPGLAEPVHFGFRPAPLEFAHLWSCNHSRFPLGVDLLIVAPDAVAGMPRSLSTGEA